MVSCTYHCGAQLQRCLLREHEMVSCPKRPQGMHITNLIQKVEDVTLENKFLRQELEAHKKEIEEIKCSKEDDLCKVKEAFQKELGVQQQEVGKLRRQVDELKRSHQRMYDSLRVDIEQNKVQKRKLVALEEEYNSLHTHIMPLPLPPFYILMRNVTHYLENGYCYTSDPFYSHPGGYKMNILTDFNAVGIHLSVGIDIVRGEFDDRLQVAI